MVKYDVYTYDVYTYDVSTDSLFIAFPVEYEYEKVIQINEDFLMEIDTNGYPRAIEILNASSNFNVEKSFLEDVHKVHMKITVTDMEIIVEILLTLGNKNILPLVELVENESHIPCNNENIDVSIS